MNLRWNTVLRMALMMQFVMVWCTSASSLLQARQALFQTKGTSNNNLLQVEALYTAALDIELHDKQDTVKHGSNGSNHFINDTTIITTNIPRRLEWKYFVRMDVWSGILLGSSVVMEFYVWSDPQTGLYLYRNKYREQCFGGRQCDGPLFSIQPLNLGITLERWIAIDISNDDKNPVFMIDGVVSTMFLLFTFHRHIHAEVHYNVLTQHYTVITSRGTREGTADTEYFDKEKRMFIKIPR